MNSVNLDCQRRCAVSKAWSRERGLVLQSLGSRNWSPKEQREIIATGKCHGYEGQHMLSVKSHPEHAGNEKNIQFLTHEEHFQAHGGNWKNDTNGHFNLKTKKVDSFNGELPRITYCKLSDPLSDRSKKIADTKFERNRKSSKLNSEHVDLLVHKDNPNNVADRKATGRNFFNSHVNKKSPKSGNFQVSQRNSVLSKGKSNGMGS